MRNIKKIVLILLIGFLAVGFFSSCDEANKDTSYTDAEKAALINKAITEGMSARTINGTERPIARPVTGGGLTVDDTIGKPAFIGSEFYDSDINIWENPPGQAFYFGLSYNNLTVTVQDNSGNTVTIKLDGSINYGGYIAADNSVTIILFGSLSGSIDGDSFNFAMDLKTSTSSDLSSLTTTGTLGGINISY